MYTQFELLDFLNFDTNTRRVLSDLERVKLHKAIATLRNDDYPKLSLNLQEKLYSVKIEMNETNWKRSVIKIGHDRIPYLQIESNI